LRKAPAEVAPTGPSACGQALAARIR